jgi:hypothetical protein
MSMCGEIENVEYEIKQLLKLFLKANERLIRLKQVKPPEERKK